MVEVLGHCHSCLVEEGSSLLVLAALWTGLYGKEVGLASADRQEPTTDIAFKELSAASIYMRVKQVLLSHLQR